MTAGPAFEDALLTHSETIKILHLEAIQQYQPSLSNSFQLLACKTSSAFVGEEEELVFAFKDGNVI